MVVSSIPLAHKKKVDIDPYGADGEKSSGSAVGQSVLYIQERPVIAAPLQLVIALIK